jgi:hypothetical protein
MRPLRGRTYSQLRCFIAISSLRDVNQKTNKEKQVKRSFLTLDKYKRMRLLRLEYKLTVN